MTETPVATWAGYVATKRELIAGLTGTVLEIGAGRGSNFGLLSPEVSWIGLEPHARSRRALRKTATASGLPWQVLPAPAERIPLPTASIDAVLSTMVLCSVGDLGAVLAEVQRVLRPNGRFVFFEHVAAERGSWTYRWQRLAAPVTRRFDRGCDPGRPIDLAIESAFETVELRRFTSPGRFAVPLIAGSAYPESRAAS
jgi:ubiquinone/menaquinone biosynthesis C-methylase UbiE